MARAKPEENPKRNNTYFYQQFYEQSRRYVLGCFTSLYHAPSALMQYSGTQLIKARDFVMGQFAWASNKTLNALYDGAQSISETAVWTGKKMQGGVDYTVETVRQQQKFAVKSADFKALSYFLAGATFAAIPASQAINDRAARNILIASLGFMAAVGSIVSIDRFLDLAVERKTLEAAYCFAHDAAVSIMKLVITSEVSAMFALSMKATATGVAVYNPITAAIISSILAAVVTTAIVGKITYYEKAFLPRDARNLFFDSPTKELEKLREKKIKYHQALQDIGGVTKSQLEALNKEILALSSEILNFRDLEGKLEDCKKALTSNPSNVNRKNYNAAKTALANAENEYFSKKEREGFVKSLISSTAVNLFKELLPGTYTGFILSGSVEHILDETLHISPQNIYNIVKEKVVEALINIKPSVQYALDKVDPVMAPITSVIKTTFVSSAELFQGSTRFVMNFAYDAVTGELNKELRKFVEKNIVDKGVHALYDLSIDITNTAIGAVDKICAAIGGAIKAH